MSIDVKGWEKTLNCHPGYENMLKLGYKLLKSLERLYLTM